MLRAVVLFAAVLAVNSQTTNVNSCTWFSGDLPINIYIEGCPQPPCQLPQLQDVVLHIIFRVPRTTGSMTTLANAFLSLLPLPIPYPLGAHAVTCNFLENSFCPVIEGEIVQYTLRLFIEEFFPLNTQANIEFRIQDANNNPVICVRVPIHIVPAIDGARSANQTMSKQ